MKNRHEYLSIRIIQEIQSLKGSFNELAGLLGKSAQSVWQTDQIAAIEALRARVVAELKHGESLETSASSGFNKAGLIIGATAFVMGGLIGAARKDKNPLSLGARLMSQSLKREEPFGTLMVSLKESSGFEEARVISISRFARDNGITESSVCSSLRAQGFLLISPNQFLIALDELELSIQERKVNTTSQVHKEFIKQTKGRR